MQPLLPAPMSDRRVMSKISVVLCTYNRCAVLREALESLARQTMPDEQDWEILVIDNNSKDDTPQVVEEFARRTSGRFRYLFEPLQGLSRARNTGIRNAKGDVIAFTDDDVIAEPDWLHRLTEHLSTGDWAGAGGKIVPPRAFVPPRWLQVGGTLDMGGALALFDLGDNAQSLERAPYGANMAFAKTVFEKYGLFREDLGRCGAGLLSGEDTEFGNRLIEAGERLRYQPASIVHHPVAEERLKKSYFRAWWFSFGRTRVIERAGRQPYRGIPREYFSIVNLLFRFLPMRTFKSFVSTDARSRFYWHCQTMLTLGEISQNWHLLQERRKGNPSEKPLQEKVS